MNRSEKFNQLAGSEIIRSNLKEKSIRGALFMAGWSGIDFMLKMVTTFILARLLVPEDFGLVAMVTAVTGVLEGIRDLGLSTATVQRNDIGHLQISNLFWINVSGGVLFFLFFCAISMIISWFYREPRLVSVTIAISTSFFWSSLAFQHEALLTRQLKQGQLAIIRLSANLLSTIAAVLLAIYQYGYWSLVWREIIRNILNSIGVWLYCPWIPGLPSKNVGIRELLRFGRNLGATNLLNSVISRIDGLLIGKFFGPVVIGMYRQAYQLMTVPIDQLNQPILNVAQPGLSRLQSDPDRYRRYYQKILFFVSFTTIPIGLFSFIYSKELVLLLLGEKWIESTEFFRIFALASAIRPAIGTSGIVLITCGKSSRFFLVSFVHSFVLCIFLIIGLQWGPVGVAIAHVMTSIVLMLPKLYYSFAKTPVSIGVFFKTMSSPFIASIVMAIVLCILCNFFIIKAPFKALILGGFVGALVYIIVLILLPISRKEVITLYKDAILSIHKKKPIGGKKSPAQHRAMQENKELI